MKQSILLLLLFAPTLVFSQWESLTHFPDNLDYENIQMLNDSVGIIQANKTVLYTTDAFATYNSIQPPIYNYWSPRSVQLFNDSTIFVGSGGSIFKSNNKGVTWDTIDAPTGVYKMHFIDSLHCVIAQPNDVHYTADGGKQWMRTAFGTPQIPENFYFINDSIGFYMADYWPVVYKTIDGGLSWEETKLNGEFDVGYTDMRFINDSVGVGCGFYQSFGITTDQGNTWDLVNKDFIDFIGEGIDCFENGMCFIVGRRGKILRFNIGDTTLTYENQDSLINLNDVWCTSEYCYSVGDEGTVLRRHITSSIPEQHVVKRLMLSPNPVLSASMVTIPGKEVGTVVVYSLSGQELSRQQISKQNRKVLSPEASGVYMLVVYNKEQQVVGSSQLMVTE